MSYLAKARKACPANSFMAHVDYSELEVRILGTLLLELEKDVNGKDSAGALDFVGEGTIDDPASY